MEKFKTSISSRLLVADPEGAARALAAAAVGVVGRERISKISRTEPGGPSSGSLLIHASSSTLWVSPEYFDRSDVSTG